MLETGAEFVVERFLIRILQVSWMEWWRHFSQAKLVQKFMLILSIAGCKRKNVSSSSSGDGEKYF